MVTPVKPSRLRSSLLIMAGDSPASRAGSGAGYTAQDTMTSFTRGAIAAR